MYQKTILLLLIFALFSTGVFAEEKPAKPNVVIFLVDDPGCSDFGFQGGKRVKTPNIDRLALNGARFTNAYTTGCVCSPTRAGLMTGRYQQRFGFDANAEGKGAGDSGIRALDIAQTTTAQRFKSLGYATAAFGKWHLGASAPEYLPQARGFDEFVGVLPFGLAAKEPDGSPTKFYRGTTVIDRPENPMEEYANSAISFIDKNKKNPFFLYLPFTHVHGPAVGTPKYLDTLDEDIPLNQRKYLADLLETDTIIGRIVDAIREKGLEENTLIFFLGDNGGPGGAADNGPLRGTKWYLWEGGIRVPFAVYWKGHIQGGRVLDQPVISLDIIRTALGVAGTAIDPAWKLDGADLLPLLQGRNNAAPHDALYWRFGSQYAVRKGDWKLLKPHIDQEPQLYNLAADIGEQTDLAKQEPEKYKELLALWNTWNAENEPERWHDPRSEGNGVGNNAKKNKNNKGAEIIPDTALGVKLKFDFTQDKDKIVDASGKNNPFSVEGKIDSAVKDNVSTRYFNGTSYIPFEKTPALSCAQTPWSAEAVFLSEKPDGVILAHGGNHFGYALYLESGKPYFSVRINQQLFTAAGQEKIGKRTVLRGVITPEKKAELYIDGKKAASVDLPDYITNNPAEPLQIGTDLGSLVSENPLPIFKGWIERIEIRREAPVK